MLAIAAAAFALTVLFQYQAGAFRAEFAGAPDAPAHYVTGLMIHDYVRGGFPASPVEFAQSFYLHYPRVAFGAWPPLFHFLEAFWFLAFSPERTSVLLFLAVWVAVLAAVLFSLVSYRAGILAGTAAALVYVVLGAVRRNATMVMLDLALTAFCFLAAWTLARYLDSGRLRYSILFGIWAGLAMLMKYDAPELLLAIPFALIMSRRLDVLGKLSFWAGPAITLALCVPWYLTQSRAMNYSMQPLPGPRDILPATVTNLKLLFQMVGPVALIVIFAGACLFLHGLWSRRRLAMSSESACMAGLILGTLIFHSVLYPLSEDRYLLPALPAIIVIFIASIQMIKRRLPTGPERFLAPMLVLASILTSSALEPVEATRYLGYDRIASDIVSDPRQSHPVILVSGDSTREGVLVSEMAVREARPGHYVLRASKMLSDTPPNPSLIRPLFANADEIRRFLDETHVSMVIAARDGNFPGLHHAQLLDALETDSRWSCSRKSSPSRVDIFSRQPLPADTQIPKLKIPMKYQLGTVFSN